MRPGQEAELLDHPMHYRGLAAAQQTNPVDRLIEFLVVTGLDLMVLQCKLGDIAHFSDGRCYCLRIGP
jgi:hypothetical protein